MSGTESGPEEAPAAAGSRLYSVIAVAVVVALLGGLIYGGVALYNKGKNDGGCDKEAMAVMSGYQAYLKAHEIGYKAEFERGKKCTDVSVTLTRVTEKDGHTTTVTCPQVKVQLPDKTRPLPYTKPVECNVVDKSTIEVGVGQPVESG